MNTHKLTVTEWLRALRPLTWTASIMPVLLTSAYAFSLQEAYGTSVEWWLLPFIFIAVLSYQAGVNMVDFKWKIARKEDFLDEKKSPITQKPTEEPWQKIALGVLAFGTIIGLWLTYQTGWILLLFGGFGLIAGYNYYYYKNYGLARDLLVFTIFGPLIALGTFFVLTGELSLMVVLIAIPTGLVNCGILHTNIVRSILFDVKAGINSSAWPSDFRTSQWRYALFIFGAFLATGILVVFGTLPFWSLLILLAFPMALTNVKTMFKGLSKNMETVLALDEGTAKLQVVFTILLALGFFM